MLTGETLHSTDRILVILPVTSRSDTGSYFSIGVSSVNFCQAFWFGTVYWQWADRQDTMFRGILPERARNKREKNPNCPRSILTLSTTDLCPTLTSDAHHNMFYGETRKTCFDRPLITHIIRATKSILVTLEQRSKCFGCIFKSCCMFISTVK